MHVTQKRSTSSILLKHISFDRARRAEQQYNFLFHFSSGFDRKGLEATMACKMVKFWLSVRNCEFSISFLNPSFLWLLFSDSASKTDCSHVVSRVVSHSSAFYWKELGTHIHTLSLRHPKRFNSSRQRAFFDVHTSFQPQLHSEQSYVSFLENVFVWLRKAQFTGWYTVAEKPYFLFPANLAWNWVPASQPDDFECRIR